MSKLVFSSYIEERVLNLESVKGPWMILKKEDTATLIYDILAEQERCQTL